MYQPDLLHYIGPEEHNTEALQIILEQHPEIKFVSFMGIDFAGNDTDEKIPIKLFIEDMNTLLHEHAAQTDALSRGAHRLCVGL